tara:strand:+ start:1347 stop:1664 length:318 start_codon:yes stop_codon:yes gene_type:complete
MAKKMTHRRAAALMAREALDLAAYRLEQFEGLSEADGEAIAEAIYRIAGPMYDRLDTIAGELTVYDVDHAYAECTWCGKRKCSTQLKPGTSECVDSGPIRININP